MKKLLTIFFLLLSVNTFATNYYVANAVNGGNDGNPGTIGAPWATITKVNSVSFVNGDIVSFNGGDIFYGGLLVTRNGVTYNSYGTGQGIITGFQTIVGWTNIGGNVWESNSAVTTLSSLNMVTIGGTNYAMGRFPNSGYLTYQSAVTTTSITSSSTNSSSTNWTGAGLVVRMNNYVTLRCPITAHSGTTISYTASNTGINAIAGFGFYIQNDTRTLDAQNEWYFVPGTKKLRIFSASSPSGVQVSTKDTLVTIIGLRSNITIDNLKFTGSNKDAMTIRAAQTITVQNCTFDYNGQDAIWGGQNGGAASTTFICRNNTFNHTNNSAITLENEFTGYLISGNTVTNSGMNDGMGGTGAGNYGTLFGIQCYAANGIIEYNNVIGAGYDGIKFDHNNVIVRNNFVTGACFQKMDGGGIYTQQPFTGQQILNNIVIDCIATLAGTFNESVPVVHGIYLDDNSANVTITGNTCAGNSYSGLFLHSSNNCNVQSNTFYDNGTASNFQILVESFNGSVPTRTTTLKHNILFSKAATQWASAWTSSSNDIASFGSAASIDSNYILTPIDDNLTNLAGVNFAYTQRSLAQWRTFSGFDTHSTKSPATITNVNQLDFEYNATNAAVIKTLPAGTWIDARSVSYSGTTTLQPYTSLVLISSGSLITPTITWANPAAITYGTALSGTQLNATSGGVPGTFVYTPVSGTFLNAGTQTLSVVFTPTDGATYTTASKSVTIVVNKAPATISYSNLTRTYTGSPLSPTITTSPAGLPTSTTYNGIGTIPTNAASYTVVTGVTDVNYTATPITSTFTISKATAVITVSNTAQIYTGSPLPVTVTTSPSVPGISVTYNGSATVPTNAGSYTVVATLTNTNYTATPVTTTLVISKKTPTVSWATPGAITYPTALSGTQLNATASVAGSFTYTPVSGTILNAGTQLLSVNFTPTDATNYNTVNGTTVTIVVNKATATLAFNNLAQTFDNSPKPITVTTTPAGLGVVTILYNGSPTAPTNAGSYTVTASFVNSNYTASPITATLVIAKAVTTISLLNLTQPYTGGARIVTYTTLPAGLTGVTVTYNGSATPPVNAGTYSIVASIVNANYTATNATGTLTVTQVTPTVSWSTPAAITFGTALSGTQLNATASVPGSFTYTPAPGTVPNAGVQTLSVNFTPTDATNYKSVNGTTVSLTVNKATALLFLNNLSQTFDGNPKPIGVTTSPVGLNVVSVTYNGSGTPPSAVGSYTVIANLANTNWTATPDTGILTITLSVDSVTISNLAQTYTGSPLPVTITTAPGTYTTDTTYNGVHVTPTNAGIYTVIATINDGSHSGADTATLIISKATPVITWANPADIVYPTSLWTTQLNAASSVAGTFTYNPALGAILNVGSHLLSVTFAPTNSANYNSVSATATIVVTAATATLTISNLSQSYDGTQKVVTVTSSPVGLSAITIRYNGSTTAPSAVGSYQVIATLSNTNYTAIPDTATLTINTVTGSVNITNILQTYTGGNLPVTVTTNPAGLSYTLTYNGGATVPVNSGSYTVIATLNDGIHIGADTDVLVIVKALPVITWANPSPITFGTALSGTQLNAVASVAGVLTYNPASGAVLGVGSQNLSVSFVATDTNYISTVKTVTITVTGATATLTLGNLSQVYDGLPKPVTATVSPAVSGIVVTYNGSLTVPTTAGVYNINVSLVNSNYTAPVVTGVLTISKASPILTWTQPAPVQDGAILDATQLNPSSTVAGTFTFIPAAGLVLRAGLVALTATFTPTDTVNYNTGTITVYLSVYGSPFLNFILRPIYLENNL